MVVNCGTCSRESKRGVDRDHGRMHSHSIGSKEVTLEQEEELDGGVGIGGRRNARNSIWQRHHGCLGLGVESWTCLKS